MGDRTPARPRSDAERASRRPARVGSRGLFPTLTVLRAGVPAWSRDQRLVGATVAIAVLVLALLLLRKPLAELLWPAARVQELSQQAAAALARGHLSAADGSGARELYEAAIAIDPDRVEARAGLGRVANAALVKAEAALAGEDFPQAHRWLALARELEVPRARGDAFARRLRAREADVAGIPQLLARADAAPTPQDALPLYARVLSLRPQNIRALEGREDALSALLQQAQAALATGDVAAGAALVATAAGFDAGHVDLPQVRSELNRATDALRQQAERDLARGRLASAEAGFGRLLALDPGDAAAQRGIAALAAAHARRAEGAAANFDFASAAGSLRHARALRPDAPEVDQAERRIAASRAARSRLGGGASVAARAGPRTRARVAALLRQAAAAEARGDLLTPPGESAYDKVRAAAALAPEAPGVRSAQRRLAPAARRCFERELPRNDLGRARACLESWVVLAGEGAASRRARTRLAQRWLAVGDERIGAGQIDAAQAALEAARSLDRNAPGIEEFRQRLRVATASDD